MVLGEELEEKRDTELAHGSGRQVGCLVCCGPVANGYVHGTSCSLFVGVMTLSGGSSFVSSLLLVGCTR